MLLDRLLAEEQGVAVLDSWYAKRDRAAVVDYALKWELTPSERAVLDLAVRRGLRREQIASERRVRLACVDKQIQAILKKTGLDRLDLVVQEVIETMPWRTS